MTGYELFRRRIGVALIRQSVVKQIRNYEQAADDAANDGEHARADRCKYISIGLRHALDPLVKR